MKRHAIARIMSLLSIITSITKASNKFFLFIIAFFLLLIVNGKGNTPTEVAKLLAGDGQAGDLFGTSVAIDGDIALISAPFDDDNGGSSGSVYVFERDSAGNWLEKAKLLPNDGAGADFFGKSVALYGNTALVGSREDDDNGSQSGSAYIFRRNTAGNWTQVAKLLPSDGEAGDLFGRSVSIDHNIAVVSADGDDDKGTNAGAVYVFEKINGVWQQNETAKILASDGQGFDIFGKSISLDDKKLIVGAWLESNENGAGSGSAYIFERDDAGQWMEKAKIIPGDGQSLDRFGAYVSLDGDIALVGNITDSVYIFEMDDAGNWNEKAKLSPDNGRVSDISLEGDIALIGTSDGINEDSVVTGAVHLFERNDAGDWMEIEKLVATDGQVTDQFGWAVALDDGTALIGSRGDDDAGSISGSSYIFDLGFGEENPESILVNIDAKINNLNDPIEVFLEAGTYGVMPIGDTDGGAFNSWTAWSQTTCTNPDGCIQGFPTIFSGWFHKYWVQSPNLVRAMVNGAENELTGNPLHYFAHDGFVYPNDILALGNALSSTFKVSSDGMVGFFVSDNHLFDNSGGISLKVTQIEDVTRDRVVKVIVGDGQQDDFFGGSVALDGNTALVGASGAHDSGAAYILTRDVTGQWMEQATLLPSGGQISDLFGVAVALDGDTALIGSSSDGDKGFQSGSAYIFHRDSNGDWTETAKILASDGGPFDRFGLSVALYDKYALVGAPGDDDSGSNVGAVYVFHRNNSGNWNEVAKFFANDGQVSAEFGGSISLYGNMALIGAVNGADNNGITGGSAYIFEQDTSGNWTQKAKLLAGDNQAGSRFGDSVSLYGDKALIGTPFDDDNGGSSGSAYIFGKDDSGNWTQKAKLLASDGNVADRFGFSVALYGDKALIGADGDNDNPVDSGSAYVFMQDDSGNWNEKMELLPDDGLDDVDEQLEERFGFSVALEGDTALIGARNHDYSGMTNTGAVYFFDLDAKMDDEQTTPVEIAELLANDGKEGDEFGRSVSVYGNMAIVGVPRDDDNGAFSGSAYIFAKDDNGNWVQKTKLLPSDGRGGEEFGRSVSLSGDVAIIGAIGGNSLSNASGSAYIFVKDSNGNWMQKKKLLPNDGHINDLFGGSVAIYGDIVVIGSVGDDDNGNASGSAYIFVKDSNGNWIQKAKLLPSDGQEGDNFGWSVSISEDIAIVGVPRDDDNGSGSGSAYIFAKDTSGNWMQKEKLLPNDGHSGDLFGRSVSISGDTAIIGAQGDDDNGSSSGSAYIFAKNDGGNWMQKAKLLPNDGEQLDEFGLSVSIYGDMAIVGVPSDDDNGDFSGSAYIFGIDSNGNWLQKAKLLPHNGHADHNFGLAVAIHKHTALIGAIGSNSNGNFSGSAYIFGLKDGMAVHHKSDFPDFSDISPLTFNGAALDIDNPVESEGKDIIRLTDGRLGQASSVFLTDPIFITEDASFHSTFSFRMTKKVGRGADGLVFVVQPISPDEVGGLGGGLGYKGITPSIGVEFDVHKNNSVFDVDDNHVGLNTNGNLNSIKQVSVSPSFEDGDVWYSWIDYDGESDLLEVRVAKSTNRPSNPILSETIDVLSILGKNHVYFGFTAGTGGASNDHDLLSWELTVEIEDDNGNHPPVCEDSDFTIESGDELRGQLNATDDDGDDLSFTETLSPSHGTITLNLDGTFVYQPDIGFIGTDSFTFTVTDEFGASPRDVCTANITVKSQEIMPIEISRLLASDGQTFDGFISSVSVDENIAIVGEFSDDDNGESSGSAYIFERDTNGDWNQVTKLLPNDGQAGDGFGWSVSVDGSVALISARTDDDNGESSGSAYIFERDTNGDWNQVTKLLPNDGQQDGFFGSEVSLDGNVALIGAWSVNGIDSGSAYIFEKDTNGNWDQVVKLIPNDGQAGDGFGFSVFLDGNTALISAIKDDDNGESSGSAYIFEKDTNGNWDQVVKLIPNDGQTFDNFGFSVELNGNVAFIGAPFHDEKGESSGSAYIFEKDTNGNWDQIAKLFPHDGQAGDDFGRSVSLNENIAIIGAPFHDEKGDDAGSTYAFQRDTNGNWNQVAKLIPDDGQSGDWFGMSIFLDGNTTLIGGVEDVAYIFNLGLDEDNQPPICEDSDFTVGSGDELRGQLNATDDDGDDLSFTETLSPSHGTITLNLDGTFVYQPDIGFIGTDSFTFTVTDEFGASPRDVCTANIVVQALDVTANRAFSDSEYSSPGVLDVSVIIDRTGSEAVTSLSVSETIPANWTFDSVTSSNAPEIRPQGGDSGTLEFSWISIPSFPVTLTYRLDIPAGESGTNFFAGNVKYRTTGGEISSSIGGDDHIDIVSFHDADQNEDFEIQLSPELTRMIQFFNSDGYHCQDGTEDGFAPGSGDEDCAIHDADQNEDFEIQLSPELTRMIQFFNSDGYHLESGTEDGFAPGKPALAGNSLKRLTSVAKNATSDDISPVRTHNAIYTSSTSTVDVSVTIEYTGAEAVTSLAVSETIPGNWTFNSVTSSNDPEIEPEVGDSGTLEFSWISIPSFPITLTYRLDIPAGESGTKSFAGEVKFRTTGDEITRATPSTTISSEDTGNNQPACGATGITVESGATANGSVDVTDADGDTLTSTLNADGTEGTASVSTDGTFTYTANTTTAASDSFTVDVNDGTDTVTCTVNVIITQPAVDDLTSSRTHDATYSSPGSIDVSVTIEYTGSETVTSLAVSETIPANWTFDSVISSSAPEIIPAANASGTLEFSWISIPSFPITLTYRLDIPAGESGTKSFAGEVKFRTTGDEITRATPSTTISSEDTGNNQPACGATGITVESGATANGNVNVTDDDGDTLTSTLNADGTEGTASVSTDGTFTYTANTTTAASDSFTVDVNDGIDTVTCTVNVTITQPGNNLPVCGATNIVVESGATVNGSVDVTDADGDTITSTLNTDGNDGAASVSTDGTFTYTANTTTAASDSFTVDVTDGTDTVTCTVNVTITQQSVVDDITSSRTNDAIYTSPGIVEVSVTIEYTGSEAVTSLAVSETIPGNWTFNSVTSSNDPEIEPEVGDSGTLEFSWISIPAFPITLTYRLNIPAGETGTKSFTGNVKYRTTGGEISQTTAETNTVSDTSGIGWQLAIDIAPSSNAVRDGVILGMQVGATDGFDSGIDQDVAPQEPTSTLADIYFDQNFTFLSTDIRGQSEKAKWLLFIDPRGNTVELSWDSQQIPSGKILSLYEVDFDDNPLPKASVSMNETTTLTVTGDKEHWYRLRYADDFRATITLTDGWNLLSFPMALTSPAVDDVFSEDSTDGLDEQEEAILSDGRRGVMISGEVWTWEGDGYVMVTSLERLKGYWVFLNEDTKTITVDGIPIAPDQNGDVIVNLSLGWNLYGSFAPITITYPLQAPLQGTIWWWDGSKYQAATVLQPFQGYWINSFESDAPFNLAK